MEQNFFHIQRINKVNYGELTITDNRYEKQTIVAKGKIGNYDFAIVNRNLFPCSYIRLNEDSPFIGKDCDDIPLYCHYGLTYAQNRSNLGFEELTEGYWIGWDYGHYGDYCRGDISDYGQHKYTEEELIQEMIFACGNLAALEWTENED